MYQKLLHSTNRLHPRAFDFIQLMRLDRPIGTYLPTQQPFGCPSAHWPSPRSTPS